MPGNDYGGERFRGSSEIPMTPEGLQNAHILGQQIANKGGLDRILTSTLGRTIQTGRILQRYTHAPIVYSGDGLDPWHLGAMEGQPLSDELVQHQKDLVSFRPDEISPLIRGRGPMSTADGESFNDFKNRALPFLQKLIADHQARPDEKTGVITHYRVRRLLDAWMRKGMNEDGEIDADTMNTHTGNEPPGSMSRFSINPSNKNPQMNLVDLKTPARLPGGIYFVRHEATPWNAVPPGTGQGAS